MRLTIIVDTWERGKTTVIVSADGLSGLTEEDLTALSESVRRKVAAQLNARRKRLRRQPAADVR